VEALSAWDQKALDLPGGLSVAQAAERLEMSELTIRKPDEFAELQGDSELLDDLGTALVLSDLGVRVHRIAELPEGELIDDEASVKRLLGPRIICL
jgi:hypothetical protein